MLCHARERLASSRLPLVRMRRSVRLHFVRTPRRPYGALAALRDPAEGALYGIVLSLSLLNNASGSQLL
eukprot:2490950-Pleurochrysis_carterae.AAC.1